MRDFIAFCLVTTLLFKISMSQSKTCNKTSDIVFVVDGSDSISDADFVRLKAFVANIIDNFEIGPDAIQVGIIVYSTLVGEKIGLYPSKRKAVLKALASNLEHPKFGTDTAAGIQSAREMISQQGRTNASKIIVVITDGRSTNPQNTIDQASTAKGSGISMIAVGVGQDISGELEKTVSRSKYMLKVANFGALLNTVNLVRDLICTAITTKAITTTTTMATTILPSISPPTKAITTQAIYTATTTATTILPSISPLTKAITTQAITTATTTATTILPSISQPTKVITTQAIYTATTTTTTILPSISPLTNAP